MKNTIARTKLTAPLCELIIELESRSRTQISQAGIPAARADGKGLPAAIPDIVFLSGGQSDYRATAHLNAMNANYDLPWKLSFSCGRALQREPMAVWGNRAENAPAEQAALLQRAKMNGLEAACLPGSRSRQSSGLVIQLGILTLIQHGEPPALLFIRTVIDGDRGA